MIVFTDLTPFVDEVLEISISNELSAWYEELEEQEVV